MNLFTKTLPQLPMYLLIALSAGGVILGDYSAKTWSIDHKTLWLVLAFVGYFFSAFFYIPSLLKEGLVVTSLLWDLLSIVGFIIIGLVIFKEKLTSLQMIGAMLGIVSLVILSFGEIIK